MADHALELIEQHAAVEAALAVGAGYDRRGGGLYMTDDGPAWFTVPPDSLDDPIGKMGPI